MTNQPTIVAEIGASHLGDAKVAHALVEAVARAGADAVKFQTYMPDSIAADVVIESGPWAGENYQELYTQGYMPWEWQPGLFQHARELGLTPFSAPFSEAAVDFLEEECDCPIYKIASMEIVHYPLIARAARTGKPLVMSTGMATPIEIQRALITARENGATDITLLHCISAYPTPVHEMRVSTINTLKNYDCKVGLSDHSQSVVPAVIAVSLGATMIEKHITLSRDNGGLDNAFSHTPDEFRNLVMACRQAAQCVGQPRLGNRESEKDSMAYRRSLWVARDLVEGQEITEDDIAVLRPADGLHPIHLRNIIGHKVTQAAKAGTPVSWHLIEKTS